jgi:6-pyruvoyl-tetrahydropterin synthase
MKRAISSITVIHNAEIAHRLSLLPGKCQNIHGHSLTIELTIFGAVDENGILAGLDFGTVKKEFRNYIDSCWDHKLHLNMNDEWATNVMWYQDKPEGAAPIVEGPVLLPGLVVHVGDPTTENIAIEIADWADLTYGNMKSVHHVLVNVCETRTNGAGCQIGE